MTRIGIAGVAAMLLLTGCGGGGGGTGSISPGQPRESFLDTAVSSDMLMFAGSELLRASADCSGLVCTYRIDGIESTSLPTAAGRATDRDFEPAGTRAGVRMGTSEARQRIADLGTLAVNTYGGWMRYGSFAVSHGTVRGEQPAIDRILLAVSVGQGSGTSPVSGSATWTGAMAGKTSAGATVQGDAALSVDFARANIDVRFHRIADVRDPGSTYPELNWRGLVMRAGAFSGQGMEGRFHGPSHEEVGGIFERDRMVGGFVAGRDDN